VASLLGGQRLSVADYVRARRGDRRRKGAKDGFTLGDVILGAIPYWKTELAISAGAAGLMSCAEALVANEKFDGGEGIHNVE